VEHYSYLFTAMTQQSNIFDSSLHKTNTILKAIADRFAWTDKHKAYVAFRAVIHTLRDRLPIESAVSFAAQLPLVLKGVFYDGWKPIDKPLKMNHLEFADLVDERMHPPYGIEIGDNASIEETPEQVISGVLAVMESYTDPAEVRKIKALLPKDFTNVFNEIAPA
jgi:uncharacterized protein (DUF2267 family)